MSGLVDLPGDTLLACVARVPVIDSVDLFMRFIGR